MNIAVVPVGNSRGIRLPGSVIKALKIEKTLDLEVREDAIILTPVHRKPRENWAAAFAGMSANGDDGLLIPDFFADEADGGD